MIAIGGSEAEGVADRDLALHPERTYAFDCQVDREGAHLSSLVQMEVDGTAVFLGQVENRIEMALWISVDCAGIEAADDVGAECHRPVDQFQRARADQQPRSCEGHDFYVDYVLEPPASITTASAEVAPAPTAAIIPPRKSISVVMPPSRRTFRIKRSLAMATGS